MAGKGLSNTMPLEQTAKESKEVICTSLLGEDCFRQEKQMFKGLIVNSPHIQTESKDANVAKTGKWQRNY